MKNWLESKMTRIKEEDDATHTKERVNVQHLLRVRCGGWTAIYFHDWLLFTTSPFEACKLSMCVQCLYSRHDIGIIVAADSATSALRHQPCENLLEIPKYTTCFPKLPIEICVEVAWQTRGSS